MNQETKFKQVIVMRHDLKMRRGKQIAQGAHASMSFLSRRLQNNGNVSLEDFTDAQRAWIEGSFAKFVVASTVNKSWMRFLRKPVPLVSKRI